MQASGSTGMFLSGHSRHRMHFDKSWRIFSEFAFEAAVFSHD
jgi:hypothetical protein